MAGGSRVWLAYVVMAGLCWGTYVPLIAYGGRSLGFGLPSEDLSGRYTAFLCVGVAYFLIAIVFPLVRAMLFKEPIPKKKQGVFFSTLAGAAGAFGALGVIFATAAASPNDRIFIAPLIFTLAPFLNTVVSLFWHPTPEHPLHFAAPKERPSWKFFLGVLCVAIGAGLILYAKGEMEAKPASVTATPQESSYVWLAYVAMAGLCWGTYVPLIAFGGRNLSAGPQYPFAGRYAAFLCVGVAYFLIAVIFPLTRYGLVEGTTLPSRPDGLIFSGLAGAAGALGALGVIFATAAAKPGDRLYIAPLIFTLAPLINTIVSLFWHPSVEPLDLFNIHGPKEMPTWKLFVGVVAAGLGAGAILLSKEELEAKVTAAKK